MEGLVRGDFLKDESQMVWFRNGRAIADYYKTRPFKIWTYLSEFQMVFDINGNHLSHFQIAGFWILDPI